MQNLATNHRVVLRLVRRFYFPSFLNFETSYWKDFCHPSSSNLYIFPFDWSVYILLMPLYSYKTLSSLCVGVRGSVLRDDVGKVELDCCWGNLMTALDVTSAPPARVCDYKFSEVTLRVFQIDTANELGDVLQLMFPRTRISQLFLHIFWTAQLAKVGSLLQLNVLKSN